VNVSVKHIEEEDFAPGSPFALFPNSFVRIMSRAKVLYYDKNSQVVKLELEDSSSLIELLSNAVEREYSCNFESSSGDIMFSSQVIPELTSSWQKRQLHNVIEYLTVY
jgi:hypothetical protein